MNEWGMNKGISSRFIVRGFITDCGIVFLTGLPSSPVHWISMLSLCDLYVNSSLLYPAHEFLIPFLPLYMTCTLTLSPPPPSVCDLYINDELYLVHHYQDPCFIAFNASMFLNFQNIITKNLITLCLLSKKREIWGVFILFWYVICLIMKSKEHIFGLFSFCTVKYKVIFLALQLKISHTF